MRSDERGSASVQKQGNHPHGPGVLCRTADIANAHEEFCRLGRRDVYESAQPAQSTEVEPTWSEARHRPARAETGQRPARPTDTTGQPSRTGRLYLTKPAGPATG